MGLLDRAVDAGVGIVQIADNLPLHELPDSELDRLGRAAAVRGLRLEAGTRTLDPAHLLRYATIAQRIGAGSIRTVMSGPRGRARDLREAQDALAKVVGELERMQLVLALENNEVFAASEYAALMRRVAAPNVGVCMDTANSLGRPELLETILDELAEHTVMLHAKDYDIQRIDTRMGFSVVGRPIGHGRVDFDLVLGRLRDLDRGQGSVIVEHWPPFLDDIESTILAEQEWLEQSLGFLRPKVLG